MIPFAYGHNLEVLEAYRRTVATFSIPKCANSAFMLFPCCQNAIHRGKPITVDNVCKVMHAIMRDSTSTSIKKSAILT